MIKHLFIIDIFLNGGPIMIPILLCSVIALTILIERIRFYNSTKGSAAQFMKSVKSSLTNRNFTESMRICRRENTPLSNVIASGIDHLDLRKDDLMDVMRHEALKQMKKYDKHQGKLATIASITPLLGLTGTVTGMISSFSIISSIGIGSPTALAGGLSEALYTTAAGLMVGIPALVAYNWCEAKSTDFAEQVEIYSLELVNMLSNMEVIIEKAAA